MKDPHDLSDLPEDWRERYLRAFRGLACRWPYQPAQRGRSPLALEPATDRYGHQEGTDRYYDGTQPRDPAWRDPRWGTGRI